MQIQYLGAFIGSIATEPINAVKVDAAVKQRQHPLCIASFGPINIKNKVLKRVHYASENFLTGYVYFYSSVKDNNVIN